MSDEDQLIFVLTEAGAEAAANAGTAGFVVDITHLGAGDTSYEVAVNGFGRAPQSALQNERQRVGIAEVVPQGGGIVSIAAVLDGDHDYYVRELGLYLSDGTLYAVYSHPAKAVFWKSELANGYITTDVALIGADPSTVQFVVGGDPIQIVTSDIRADLSGKHNPGGNFNFALTQNIKGHMYMAMEEFERLAQVRRSYGQSGVTMGRHYSFGGDAAYHRPSAVSFAALGVHNHPNYPLMCGMPEISAVVNGYEVNTRHVDYKIVHTSGDAYLAVDDAVPPQVPPSVAAQATPEDQISEMREYLRAFGAKDPTIRDYRPYFDSYLSVVEVWLEELTGDELVDTFPSFRHQLSKGGHRRMNDDYMTLLASGLKSRFENDDFKPTVIRVMREDGAPQFAVLRYKVSAVRLGTYGEYPIHQMVSQVDDPMTRQRWRQTDQQIADGRLGRFRVNHTIGDDSISMRSNPGLLDEIMGKVPGLDGLGATIHEEFTDTDTQYNPFVQRLLEYKTTDRMNSAFYRRFYSYETAGAAGRRDYRFGYNDPMLFRAATTQNQVVALPGMGGGHRLSWAIPLELIVASPLASWNPYNIPEGGWPAGDGKTQATAYSNAHRNGRWFMTPAVLFDGYGDVVDPADTNDVSWMMCGDGQARRMYGSGVYIRMPQIAGVQAARMRYPIAPVHHEGSFEFGHIEAVRNETQRALAALANEIHEMKHTAGSGGNNGA